LRLNLTGLRIRNLRGAALFAGVVGLLVYSNALGNRFAFDDVHLIPENQGIQTLTNLPEALWKPWWPGAEGKSYGLWRPVSTAALGLQWAVWGNDPTGYHAVNLLLHAGATFLVVLLLGELIPVTGALVGGLVFAVHPVHVEAVANIVGVCELLSTVFFLAAGILVLRGGLSLGPSRTAAVVALFALALLSKESAITFPGVVLLLDSSREDLGIRSLGRYLRARWPLYAGLLAVMALVFRARKSVLGSIADPLPPLGAGILEEIPRIWTVALTWLHVLRLMVFPMDLVADYSPDVIPIAFGWNAASAAGAALVLGLLALALFTWRKGALGRDRVSDRAVGWSVVWMVLTLSVTSNLFFLSGILLAERTLYLPSVGFALGVGWAFLRWRAVRPRLAPLVLLTGVLLLGFRSWTRTPTWKNTLEVFSTLADEHPESGRAQWILGDTYFDLGRQSEALQWYRIAAGTLRSHYSFLTSVGSRLMTVESDQAAEALLVSAWRSDPAQGQAQGLLAGLYDRQARFQEAEAAARAALEAGRTQASLYHILSRSLQAQGRTLEAIEAREATIRNGEAGHWQQWVWLAQLQMDAERFGEAIASLDSARARAPSPAVLLQIDSLQAGMGKGLPGP